jgi:AcrR family transcriptional regulator
LHYYRQTRIWNSNESLKKAPGMTRPSEITRDRILKAAERLFADRGYEATSVRAIVAKARVNQAAINYHFAGKDGLYREVLRAAFRALTEQQLSHAQEMEAMSREQALGEFVRHHCGRSWRATSSAGISAYSIGRRCARRPCFASS